MRRALPLGVGLLLVGCASLRAETQAPEEVRREPSAARPHYAAGELLVKVTPEAAQAIEQARASQAFPRTGLGSLDQLFTDYGITAIERVFPHTSSPELSRTYKLSLSPDQSVQAAAAAFSRDPHVEYAQPNYVATVYRTPEVAQ